jgi:DNA-binding GntR family transcriptional regulator
MSVSVRVGDKAAPAAGGGPAAVRYYMLGDQIREEILGRILKGDLVPGDRVVETRIARELGVSQGPVREALRDLASMGLVELLPYRGARVRRPTFREIGEAIRVRAEIEAMAAAEAAPRLTEEDVSELRRLVGEMEHATAVGDVAGYVSGNTRFHQAIVRASQNHTLERIWRMLQPVSRTHLSVAVAGLVGGASNQAHLGLVEGLASRDPERAAAAARIHSRIVERTLAEAYEKAWGPLDVEEGSVSGEGSLGG